MTTSFPKANLPSNPNRKTKGSPPAFKIYRVVKAKSNLDKDIWTEVAACWPHQDGNGFNVKFNFNEAPQQGAQYVMRRDRRSSPEAVGGQP